MDKCKLGLKSKKGNTYIETLKSGQKVVRIKEGLSKKRSIKEFEKAAKSGQTVCLTDLFINSGM